MSKLNRELVMRALTRLGRLAIEEGLQLECCIYGGALMMLAKVPGYTGDLDDLRFLIRKMEIHDVEEIQKRIDQYYPDDVIPPAHRETLRILIAEVWA